MEDLVQLERKGGLSTLWLNRPQLSNAFDEKLIEQLDQALIAASEDDSVRVLVLAGRGKHFCAGADLAWMQRAANASAADNVSDARAFAAMLARLANFPKPTVARIHGAAMAGGTGLAAACDIVVASTAAVFSTSEVRFGIIPAVIGPYVVAAIGQRQSRRYFQSAEAITAERAWELGLVHEITLPEQLDQRLESLIADLLKGAPGAQHAAKRLIGHLAGDHSGVATQEFCAQAIAKQRASAEAREGFAAFFAKRPPAWAQP